MEVKLGYNSLVNSAFEKLGTKKGFCVEIHSEYEKKANELLEALKDEVLVELKFTQEACAGRGSLKYFGLTVAKASGRDSGAFVPPGVALISGKVGSGGSMKNWHTYIDEGSIIRLKVPRLLYEKHKNRYKVLESRIVDDANNIKVEDLL